MPSLNATSPAFALLPARAIVALSGEDRATFIQGLISNDVLRVGDKAAIYAALLTPQGKYLHDFFIAETDGRLLIDCERERAADLRRRLSLYKLRSRVTIAEASDLAVAALWGNGAAAALDHGRTWPGASLCQRRCLRRSTPANAGPSGNPAGSGLRRCPGSGRLCCC